MKEKDPKATLKTLMFLVEVQKLDGSENLDRNLERNQTTHLQG
jgi:hypothetical protein